MLRKIRDYLRNVLAVTAPFATTIGSAWTPAHADYGLDIDPNVVPEGKTAGPLTFERPNYIDGPDLYAKHRSHSSHSSHSSHRSHSSHYSSSGGTYYVPSAPALPSYSPSAPSTPDTEPYSPPADLLQGLNKPQKLAPATPPASATPRTPAELIVLRVQMALKSAGYYNGIVDAKPGPKTVEALKNFQRDNMLPVTGTLDNGTLAMLGISY